MQCENPSVCDVDSKSRGWWLVADRLGATASFLCAVHCALLPFVIALLPLVGLEFLADHAFERGFVLFAAALATTTLVTGNRKHRQRLPMVLAVPGLILLVLGVTVVDLSAHTTLHSIMVTCGGLLVASAHVVNLRLVYRAHALQHAH
ncbi:MULTISPECIES: MerC domain-containing protein [Oleiagrimonas]|jgi:uncharacterized membrane protein YjjB (DUF3815 family)|uniref:MerC domain-containing protein n=1 Tax=Oleiagrimonas citrea TaxID=1665687 RepID=A0A846ZL05_9GAMM|nr:MULTISPECIES: MerC domain-containing protein [Oleiagrimonas]NKZ38854.1 MerC domain-containing protein [Oleiagrimonas citrea]RAP59164.1 hypothetical protein BTJ49_00260 [Oleiagrimonas sp. MCCC 1A03011]